MIRPAPGVPIEMQAEDNVLRMLIWGEARGESARGKLAVAWVLRNRALARDTSLKHEALRDRQFSCFNDGDPNRDLLLQAWRTSPTHWHACDAVAELFEQGCTIDPTFSATHYYVEKMDNPPAWGRGHAEWKETVVIGSHLFGRAA